MTHTPGPWRYQIWGSAAFQQGAVESRAVGIVICDIPKYEVAKDGGEAEANARLISAAPDLLAAVKLTRAWLLQFSMPEKHEHLVRIDAAIAKAEGAA